MSKENEIGLIESKLEKNRKEHESLKMELLNSRVRILFENNRVSYEYSCNQMDKHHLIHEDFIDGDLRVAIEDCIEDIQGEYGLFADYPEIIEVFTNNMI